MDLEIKKEDTTIDFCKERDDEITINLRALTGRQRNNIAKVLDQALNDIKDETNEVALETLQKFVEE